MEKKPSSAGELMPPIVSPGFEEAESLRFQIGMSKVSGRGGRRYLPYAFTEQGVAMLSSVLNSKRAVQVNIAIVLYLVASLTRIPLSRPL